MVNAIAQMSGTPVLIIGDMVADVYLDGAIARISREAPVLVLDQVEERVVAGGAANVVNNAATLGGTAYAAGVCGTDTSGDALLAVLAENAVRTEGFVRDDDILQGLDIACRGSLADDVQPAEDLQAVNGYRFVKAAVGAILLDESLDERRHR